MASHTPPFRLVWAAVLACAALIGVALVAVSGQAAIERSFRVVLEENVPSLRAALGLQLALYDQKGKVSNYLLEPSEELLEGRRSEVDVWIAEVRSASHTPFERELVAEIEERYESYDALRDEVVELQRKGERARAVELQLGRVTGAADDLRQACERLLSANDGYIAASRRSSEALIAWLRAGIWGGVLAVLALGSLAGWLAARAAGRRLAESERLATLGQMAGSLAHEIRNPLTAIGLRLEALRCEDQTSPAAREDVEVIQEEVGRLERIVGNFLGLARNKEAAFLPVELNQVLARAAELVRPSFERQGLRLRQSVPRDLPRILGDPEALLQILLNLLLNASQAMPGGGEIEISARALAAPGKEPRVELRVRDQGGGIPPAVRERIFDPFFSTRPSGIGLGLAIVRRAVEQHGGRVELERSDASGSCFRILMPAVARGAAVAEVVA